MTDTLTIINLITIGAILGKVMIIEYVWINRDNKIKRKFILFHRKNKLDRGHK